VKGVEKIILICMRRVLTSWSTLGLMAARCDEFKIVPSSYSNKATFSLVR